MSTLRLYDEAALKLIAAKGAEGKKELERKLDMVKTSIELTDEERSINIDRINFVLHGCVHHTKQEILDDIEAGSADIDDMGGY